jgi:hypothetical protein
VRAFAFVVLLAGCFAPDLGDGAIACGVADDGCPPRYFCHADRRCYKTPDSLGSDVDLGADFDFSGDDFAACTRATCDPEACGVIADNCGSTLDCGNSCSTGKSCGGGGTPHECGCATQVTCGSHDCGTMPDGCGGVVSCGASCPTGQTCGGGSGGGKTPNVCGTGSCSPKTCTNKECGLISDNCSAVIDCGACSSGKSCGSDHLCH